MKAPEKEKATQAGGSSSVSGGQAGTAQNRVLNCSTQHINKKCRRIATAGLQLRGTATDTQLTTLPKLLAFLGEEGINTYEAVAAGYLRIATRVKELEDVWDIDSRRENVIGPDGLFHKGIARYVLRGKKERPADAAQPNLGVEVAV